MRIKVVDLLPSFKPPTHFLYSCFYLMLDVSDSVNGIVSFWTLASLQCRMPQTQSWDCEFLNSCLYPTLDALDSIRELVSFWTLDSTQCWIPRTWSAGLLVVAHALSNWFSAICGLMSSCSCLGLMSCLLLLFNVSLEVAGLMSSDSCLYLMFPWKSADLWAHTLASGL